MIEKILLLTLLAYNVTSVIFLLIKWNKCLNKIARLEDELRKERAKTQMIIDLNSTEH